MTRSRPVRALSVRQPFAEQIMAGTKRFEYRSIRTNIRERVYVYASMTRSDAQAWKNSGHAEGTLPIGILIGTVEVTGCFSRKSGYAWKLENPARATRKLRPTHRPQPVWFKPFG